MEIKLGDQDFYGDRIRRMYLNLIKHCDREMEGASAGDPVAFSYSEFESLVSAALAAGSCYHCGRPLKKWNWSPDHMRTLSIGGTSELSNIRIICNECNKNKGHLLDDELHRKIILTGLANLRMESAGRSLPYPCAGMPWPSHTGDVDKAARGIAKVRLNAAQMRSYVEAWSTSGSPKVEAIFRIVLRAFDGELTKTQALKEMAQVTGDYAAVKLRLEKGRQLSPPNGATKSTPERHWI